MKHTLLLMVIGFFTIQTLSAHGDTKKPSKFGHDKDFKEISQQVLAKMVRSGKVAVIDANGTKSWKDGHIPGAIDYHGCSEAQLKQKLPKDKTATIIAYCGGPGCNAWKDAATKVKKLGYTNIKHFRGGLVGWMKAGKKLEKSKS